MKRLMTQLVKVTDEDGSHETELQSLDGSDVPLAYVITNVQWIMT